MSLDSAATTNMLPNRSVRYTVPFLVSCDLNTLPMSLKSPLSFRKAKTMDFLDEGVTEQQLTYVSGPLYLTATKKLFGSIKAGNISVKLPLTKIDSVSYLLKASGHEELLPLARTAAMDKDFTVRNKAQQQLFEKMADSRDWLKDNLFSLLTKRDKPKVSKNLQGKFVIEYKDTESGQPYIKLVRNDHDGYDVISFHDSEYALKKKSYNDSSSFKRGSLEKRAEIRARNGAQQ